MNKILILCAVIASVFCMSAQAMQSLDEFRAKFEAQQIRNNGHIVQPSLYGDTEPTHLEYDIVHKDGSTEHCYQIMEGHSIQCH